MPASSMLQFPRHHKLQALHAGHQRALQKIWRPEAGSPRVMHFSHLERIASNTSRAAVSQRTESKVTMP